MFSLFRSSARRFSSSALRRDRAVVYAQNGNPAEVLSVFTYPNLPPPPPNTVNLKFLLAPINPADVNVIEGVYPTKPAKKDTLSLSDSQTFYVGGNEGLARVTALGDGVGSLSVGDWVIMTRQQAGTWTTDRNVEVGDVAKVPDSESLTEAQAATLTVRGPEFSGCPVRSLHTGQPSNSIQHALRFRGPQSGRLGHSKRCKQRSALCLPERSPFKS